MQDAELPSVQQVAILRTWVYAERALVIHCLLSPSKPDQVQYKPNPLNADKSSFTQIVLSHMHIHRHFVVPLKGNEGFSALNIIF